jgi:hypothetical protein
LKLQRGLSNMKQFSRAGADEMRAFAMQMIPPPTTAIMRGSRLSFTISSLVKITSADRW